jgi:spore coat polysaccharide biosynthesis protein SpsF (cytidylyltransferase family)
VSEIKFNDYYGQYVCLNNNTASGNLRLRVRTTKDLNQIKLTEEKNCDIETDISLNINQAKLLHAALSQMIDGMEDY